MIRFKGHFYKWVTEPHLFSVRPLTNRCWSKYKKDIWSHKEIQESWWVEPFNRTICPPFPSIAFSTRGRGGRGQGGRGGWCGRGQGPISAVGRVWFNLWIQISNCRIKPLKDCEKLLVLQKDRKIEKLHQCSNTLSHDCSTIFFSWTSLKKEKLNAAPPCSNH